MARTDNSFLMRRRAELLSDKQAVPLAYEELRKQARKQLPQGPYDYAAGGAGFEETMHENRAAFRRYRILPRVLQDISERNLEKTLFDREIAAPLMLAPIGGQVKYHDEGELASARAARDLNIPIAVSTNASHSIEDIASANDDGPRLFQLYWPNDWEVAASLVERAEAANYDGIIFTVDSRLPKWRQRNLQNSYEGSKDAPNMILESDPVVQKRAEEAGEPLRKFVHESSSLSDDPSITWNDLDALQEWTNLPIILKGILSADDARRATEIGVDGIIVSNHGGRQIDGEVSPLTQLSAVIAAVDEEMIVGLDSGVRSGADVFKALALGADLVQFGRPYIFGLAIAGQQGVYETTLNYLAELESIMGLSGYPFIDDIDENAIVKRPDLV